MAGTYTYFIEENGRVGRVLDAKTCEYAYGKGQHPRNKASVKPLNEAEHHKLFCAQQKKMWADVQQYLPLAKRLARKAVLDREAREELVSAVGIPILCYASVTWNVNKSSFHTYASRALYLAYRKYKDMQSAFQFDDLEIPNEEHKNSKVDRLICAEELYLLGLSASELALLKMRFESGLTLDEIAIELGLTTRQGVLNRINKIIDKCQNPKT